MQGRRGAGGTGRKDRHRSLSPVAPPPFARSSPWEVPRLRTPGAGSRGAERLAADHAGRVASVPIVVHPPSPTGGRRVRVNGEILGLAYNAADVAEFLRRAGLDIDAAEVGTSPLIDWRGIGPEYWGPET